MSDTDPSATLASLSSSLSTLEGALAPLLAKPLDDHLDGQDPLVQARMQILASYVVHDLIWVYLKTAGVDPATHPVMAEIERLKGYFGKLKAAQSGAPAGAEPSASASRPRMAVDKRAANRFITAAISSSRPAVDPDYTPADGEGGGDAEAGPSGTHIRFDEGEVERLLEDEAGEDEQSGDAAEAEVKAEKSARKGKKRESEGGAVEEVEGAQAKGKKRKVLDPFAGYDQPKPSPPAPSTKNPATKSSRRRSTANAEAAAPTADDSSVAGSPAPADNAGAGLSKSQKKKLARKQQAAAAAAAAEGAEAKKQ